MATPNEQEPPKKPTPPAGAVPGAARPAVPGTPPAYRPAVAGVTPGAPRPAVPGAKPAAPAPPGVKPANGTPAPRPAGTTPPAGTAPVAARPSVPTAPRPAGATPPVAGPRPAVPSKPGAAPPPPAKMPVKPGLTPPAKPSAPAAPGAPAAKAPPAGDKPAAPKAPTAGAPGKGGISSSKHKPAPVKASTANRNAAGRRIGQVLIDLGYIDEDQLWELLDEAKNTGSLLGQTALARGVITAVQLDQALAEQFGLKLLQAEELKPTPEALTLVPETMASVYKVLPLTARDGVLTVAVGDPAVLPGLDDLRNFLNLKEIQASLAPQAALNDVLAKCYLGKEESIIDLINSLQQDDDGGPVGRETSIDLANLLEMQDAAPVRKLLNMVLLLAIKDRASDIHFEPFEEEYKLRYRCDGVMYEMVPPPRHLAMAISTRIKVMANLDIAERRLPQDGRIELNVGGNQVDLRVSILPTMFGESAVIRVLDRGNVGLDLNRVGMPEDMLTQFREIIKKPNGICLVTGPTGSGKTTTLYSALSELNDITEKLITTEDPIEYDIDGIVQVPINSDIGVTFAAALRAILRQDPDKILVGEIRDLETAQIAVQAALTGHMVFSTLHTNDAPSTITRMRDMGLETFLITATVEAILAQRLVRKICEDCKTEFDPSEEMLLELSLKRSDVQGKKFYYGRGCDRCNNSGYKGRTGIHELIIMNDDLRDLVSSGASTDQLRNACRKMGMVTLRDAGMRAIHNGKSTIEEIVRETAFDDD